MKKYSIVFVLFAFIISLLYAFFHTGVTYTPIIEGQESLIQGLYFPNEIKLTDPTTQGQQIYGDLTTPFEVKSYYFIPAKNGTITIDLAVPARPSDSSFRPAWEIIGPNMTPQAMQIEFSIPTGSTDVGHDYYVPPGNRNYYYDSVSMQKVYHGNIQQIPVLAGQVYYLNIFEPLHYMGDYILKVGDKKTFPYASISYGAKSFLIMLGLTSGNATPWIDIAGYFLTIGGLILGLGTSLSLVFFLFLERKSAKWTEIILEFYKPAIQIIRIGMLVFTIGSIIVYRESEFSGVALWQLFLLLLLIFISMVLDTQLHSRFHQSEITDTKVPLTPKKTLFISSISLILCLWLEVLLFVWYLLVTR